MNSATIHTLRNGSESDVIDVLQKFNDQNAQAFDFKELTDDAKEKTIETLFSQLSQQVSVQCQCLCLQTLRLFSREKSRLGSMVSDVGLAQFMRLAGLEHYSRQCDEERGVHIQLGDPQVTIEAQKCLCNLIFNSVQAQAACSKNGCVEGIVQRLKTYKDPDLQFDIKFFDMRLLFLLTALCADTRPKIRFELHGFTYMIEVIDLMLRDAEGRSDGLTDQEVDLCSEILKILFNLTVTVDRNNLDEEEDAHMMRLVCVLRDLLLCNTVSKDKREGILSHTVNLLINMPRDCYEELLAPMNEGEVSGLDNKEVEYDGKNMEAIVILLNFLHERMDRCIYTQPTKSLKESLTPILHCLCETCRANRSIRKFCRAKVLPPLKDEVKHLPEEGNTLRNRLCKLLTSPILEVKELAADFLFVLCKESVQRMVKYTGYGNCAGLLANRGLLLGGQGQGDYSSNSEDSETEEYSNLVDKLNPITGRVEEARSRPWELMTEEQKEYEAMKLVTAMDKLNREGIIQPSTIGEDGRPVPVSHILQLVENQPNIPPTEEHDDN